MAIMNISLPETMKKWVNSQIKTGRYGDASDYMRDLIRRDQDQLSKISEIRAQLESEAKGGKNNSVKAKGEIAINEKAKSGNTNGNKNEQSTADIRKNVLAHVKKNWRPSE
ncbi:MAG: type II toxin-antitoxin system ParD family antitoxin [Hyphomicrobiales bacterium]|nr:type II toxin-antitoxin system ParD family antitoxin [Hyphomicrobiales bacterium]